MDAALAKDLIRKFQSPSFHAPAALLAAIARCEPTTGLPEGLMKVGLCGRSADLRRVALYCASKRIAAQIIVAQSWHVV